MPALTGANYIAGRASSEGETTYPAVDARTHAPLGEVFHDATPAEVRAATGAAREVSRTQARELWEARAALLTAIAAGIGDLGDELLDRIEAECGLPKARNLGERDRTMNQLRMFAELVKDGSWVDARLDTADPTRQPVPKPSIRRMLVPLGPVAVFGASNFPQAFSVAGGDTASALAAGAPVVCKVHPGHPGVSELVAGAINHAVAEVGAPAGTFSLLHGGTGNAVSEALVTDDAIEAVAFTGSYGGGSAIMRLAAGRPRPIPVYAEMGSINPFVVLPGAYAESGDAILDQLAAAIIGSMGQLCTKPGVVIGTAGIADKLAERLKDTRRGVMLNQRLGQGYVDSFHRMAGRPSVTLHLIASAAGEPAVLSVPAEEFIADPALHEEMFGPAALVVVAETVAAMTAVADALPGQLTGTIHATHDELEAAPGLLGAMARKAGRLVLGGVPTGVEVGPAQQHGGPFPATSDARSTSVGTAAITRFTRPIAYQGFADDQVPAELRDDNPLGLRRLIDGKPET
jgi:2,5-dioxopentanoate dehydrogenase